MAKPTQEFIRAACPKQKQVAEAVPLDYDYLRQIAGGQEPSADTRRLLALWGWRHVHDLVDRLFVLDPQAAADQVAAIVRLHAESSPDDDPAPPSV